MRFFTSLVVPCALLTMTSACSAPAKPAAAPVPHSISAEDFKALTEKPGTVVLDVRTAEEYTQGHLANARLMDVESGDFNQSIAGLNKTGTYALYCRSGRRSKTAMSLMHNAGFTTLSDLEGGIQAWQDRGLEIKK